MNTKTLTLLAIICLTFHTVGLAAPIKTYQVTGPILEMNDTMISVQKGKDRWDIARDSSTKANKELKVGDKVTVTYRMTATQVDGKAGKADKAAPAEKKSDKTATAEATPSPTPRPAGSPKREF